MPKKKKKKRSDDSDDDSSDEDFIVRDNDVARRSSKKTKPGAIPPLPARKNGAVGLPNKSGADCFWLSVIQCMRHTPGFSESLRRGVLLPRKTRQTAVQNPLDASGIAHGMTKLMDAMDTTHELLSLPGGSNSLHNFRELCCTSLSGDLVDARLRNQNQEDVHEFLLSIVEALDNREKPEAGGCSAPATAAAVPAARAVPAAGTRPSTRSAGRAVVIPKELQV